MLLVNTHKTSIQSTLVTPGLSGQRVNPWVGYLCKKANMDTCCKCSKKFDPKPWQVLNHHHICKSCRNVHARKYSKSEIMKKYRKEYRQTEKAKKYLKEYRSTDKFKKSKKDYVQTEEAKKYRSRAGKKYRAQEHVKIKIRARQAVHRALKSGTLVKQPCEVCQSKDSQAHHEDYAKPLEVCWLCMDHHKERHRILKEMGK